MLLAQRSIPAESIPFKGRGFKLHSTITFLFSSCSTVQNSTNPLTIVRGPSASPLRGTKEEKVKQKLWCQHDDVYLIC